jgi:hypothetical protein
MTEAEPTSELLCFCEEKGSSRNVSTVRMTLLTELGHHKHLHFDAHCILRSFYEPAMNPKL